MKTLIASFILLNFLVACASPKPKVVEAEPAPFHTPKAVCLTLSCLLGVEPATIPDKRVVTSISETGEVAQPIAGSNSTEPSASTSTLDSVYFATDSYVVKEADNTFVQAHIKYLMEHPSRTVRVEGNTDEQGSNEYNLALGQLRADNVKKMLILGGVKGNQIEATSYGEENPKATGHDETSWSQNRRVDFSYGTEADQQ